MRELLAQLKSSFQDPPTTPAAAEQLYRDVQRFLEQPRTLGSLPATLRQAPGGKGRPCAVPALRRL